MDGCEDLGEESKADGSKALAELLEKSLMIAFLTEDPVFNYLLTPADSSLLPLPSI